MSELEQAQHDLIKLIASRKPKPDGIYAGSQQDGQQAASLELKIQAQQSVVKELEQA